ncbi:MAG: permease, partial [Bacteroidota bacterium]
FISVYFLASFFKLEKNGVDVRTIKMLLPSLAPGLSCFPFILEYFGESTLANAAIADIGNKVFVLIILYLLALKWYHKYEYVEYSGKGNKLKSLAKSLIQEPVNLVIIAGIGMLLIGINYETMPSFLRGAVDRLSMMMTPLVLVFIGISVKLDWKQLKVIWSILLFRSGCAFLFSGLVLMISQISDPMVAMLIILFPQSSCSFWPYAHMSAINKMGEDSEKAKTFNLDLGMNMLALSLPLSTLIILALSTYGEKSADLLFVFILSGVLITVSLIPNLLRRINTKFFDAKEVKMVEKKEDVLELNRS